MAQTPQERAARLRKITSNITDLEYQTPAKTFYGMGFGEAGTGKTTTLIALAQQIRGDGRILHLDSGQGWVSLDNIPSLKRDVLNYRVTDPADLPAIANALLLKKKGFENISVVVLDEGSSLFTTMLHDWVREQNGLGPDEDLPEIEGKDYSAPGAAFLNMVKKFIEVPDLHFLIVAHEQGRNVQGDAQQKKMSPSFGPKLTNDILQLLHVAGRFESRQVKGEYEREVQSWPTRYVVAKSRVGSLALKEDAIDWVQKVAEWINSSRMAEDLAEPAPAGPDIDTPDEGGDEDMASTDDDDFEVHEDDN